MYDQGNTQYTNVNWQQEKNGANTLTGNVGNSGPEIFAQGFDGSGNVVPLKSAGGVADVDPTADTMVKMTLTMQDGWSFSAFDLKLDENNGQPDGTVTFFAYDASGNIIPPSGSPTFPIDATGQNPYEGIVVNGEPPIHELVFETDGVTLSDLKQLSVEAVQTAIPEPTSFVLCTIGVASVLGVGWRRSRRPLKS